MGMIEWLRRKLSTNTPTGPVGFTEGIHETGAGAFRREHGYSEATTPMEATAEIAAHNAEIDAEYSGEIARRQRLYEQGLYHPRFFETLVHTDPVTLEQTIEVTDRVQWHLELTMGDGRRLDVTKDTGVPQQAGGDSVEMAGEVSRYATQVAYLEGAKRPEPKILSDVVGTWDAILDACGGNADTAMQVVKSATAAFGVEGLDSELPKG